MEAWWQAGGAGRRIAREEGSSPHPITGEALTITAPWPKDLTVAVKYLRRYAAAYRRIVGYSNPRPVRQP